MKDIVTIEFDSICGQEKMLATFKTSLPDFQWRGGDSDMQGLYISGRNKNSVNIQIWISESPNAATVSFRSSWLEATNRDVLKQAVVAKIVNDIIPTLGTFLNQKDN